MTTYVTVAIPFVNAAPHLGYAFELVEADLCARACRAAGEPVRFLGGTDDHSLKNVLAAEAAGEPTPAYVARQARRFAALRGPLELSFDDFIHTSADPRHRPAVERLWRACAGAGDLERRPYAGRYCVGCEQFFQPGELVDGRCPEHDAPLEEVVEENWFFRLSRYQEQLLDVLESGELAVGPEPFRNEVLAFVRAGLQDLSVSRSVGRARGWGVPVPDDPGQVVYVWFDALTNYLSALDFGTGGAAYRRWWHDADRRVHVVGKGIVRFHAVYWPAFLLSAGLPLPTEVHVHPYLTAGGAKISKSGGTAVDPVAAVGRYGADALRWWFAREVSPVADTDITDERLLARADDDLANGIGNAVSRVTALVHRHRGGVAPDVGAAALSEAEGLAARVLEALRRFDRRAAAAAVVAAVNALNREVEAVAPWSLAHHPAAADRLDHHLDAALRTLAAIGEALRPLVPALAERVAAQVDRRGALPPLEAVFPRLERV